MPCLDWCNAWTCEEYEQGSCGACTACGGTEPQSEIVASSTAAGGGCLPWCSEWTCNKATDCGACAACMPNPPPPPLMPNSFLDNPFAALAGWYVNPTLRSNLQATLRSASPGEAAAVRAMLDVPSAFWIDNKAKIRGHGLDTLQGILADAARHTAPPLVRIERLELPTPG